MSSTSESVNADILARRQAFGRRLRALREAKGLTQLAMAESAGLDRSFYSQIESGARNVSLDRIFALADAAGVPTEVLFTDRAPESFPREP